MIFFPSIFRSHQKQRYVEIGLHGDQIRHAKKPRINGRRAFNLESGRYRVAFEPQHVDHFDRFVGGIVELQRQLAFEPGQIGKFFAPVVLALVVFCDPDVKSHVGAELQ